MNDDRYVIAYDIGTTGVKTCLYRLGGLLELVDAAQTGYPLFVIPGGGAEQRADDWWAALCATTREIFDKTGVPPDHILGVSFCCQMQGFVPVDEKGHALRNPMIYMDGRSVKPFEEQLMHGLIRIAGANAYKVLASLYITGGMAGTPKDPLWKYHWFRENEPELFARMSKWLDVKDYLNMRCTGRAAMTPDSANITFVYDTRPGKLGWSRFICDMFKVDMKHLPEIVQSTDVVGGLTQQAAGELGLKPGTPVFGGGGDASCIPLGAGCTDINDTHIYVGTSGWVIATTDRRMVDVNNFIASILCAIPGLYIYIGEQDTSGVCLQWVRDHLALDEIGVYLKEHESQDAEQETRNIFELMNSVVEETPPGAGGVIFTPWLHGNRSPRQDAYARGMFFNLQLDTGKRMMIRSVLEGVAMHKRWLVEAIEKKIPRRDTLRFVGGGARSRVWRQIMADVTGRDIEVTANPHNAGAAGAALIAVVGLGMIKDFQQAKRLIPVEEKVSPRPEYKAMYDKHFDVFKQLYEKNKKLFRTMNRDTQVGEND